MKEWVPSLVVTLVLATACLVLGGVPDTKTIRKAAEQGEVNAQLKLGVMYYNGEGVPKNLQEAAKWFHKAAEQGDAEAQYSLGMMYNYGEGVPTNLQEAVKWYRKAAEQGDELAQYSLGIMYYEGLGVPESPVYAYAWLGMSNANGHEKAKTALDDCASEMSASQIEEAKRLSREWFVKYKKR